MMKEIFAKLFNLILFDDEIQFKPRYHRIKNFEI